MPSDVLTLADVAARTNMLAVACRWCDRVGHYRIVGLINRYGPAFSIPELGRVLSADCPQHAVHSIMDRCGVGFPDLPGLFLPR